MDIEFHYYITRFIAQEAGLPAKDAQTLAEASQYTDDNTYAYDISDPKTGKTVYTTVPSQTMNPLKGVREQIETYAGFHFMPGDMTSKSARRKDWSANALNTTPNSPRANEVLGQALEAKDLYQIGIAVHMYADTWAHQNFVGAQNAYNAMDDQKLVPNIGHADAGHKPDVPGLIWKDTRLIDENSEVHNKDRFLDAAVAIFKKLRLHVDPDCPRETVDKDALALRAKLSTAIGEEFRGKDTDAARDARIARYVKLIEENGGTVPEYDEDAWVEAAVDVDVHGLPDSWTEGFTGMIRDMKLWPDSYSWKEGYEKSDFYRFQEAVRAHRGRVRKVGEDLYKQAGVDPKDLDDAGTSK